MGKKNFISINQYMDDKGSNVEIKDLETLLKEADQDKKVSEAEIEVPESLKDFAHENFGLKERFKKIKSFFKTRLFIKAMRPIYDLPARDVKKLGLMGPFTYKLYQSALVALPTIIFLQILNLTAIEKPARDSTALSPVNAESQSILPEVERVFNTFLVPTSFLLIAWIIGWALSRKILLPQDITDPDKANLTAPDKANLLKRAERRCRDGFLYYEATYSLWPQMMLMPFFTIILGSVNINPVIRLPLTIMLVVLFIIGFCWSIYVTWEEIPNSVISLHKYPVNTSQWGTYVLASISLLPLILFLRLVFVAIAVGVTYLLAVIKVGLKALLT